MISERLKWRQTYLAYKEAFPQYFGDIVVVIDGATPDLADQARDRLAESLERETGLFESVYLPGGGSFFKRHGLLYLDIEELEDLSDNLAQVQPFLGKVVQDQSLIGLFSMLDSAMEAVLDGEEVDLVPVFDRLSDAFGARIDNRFHRVSWQELMLGRTSTPDERRRFIMLQSRLDFTELLQGEAAIAKIRELSKELALDEAHGVVVRLTGSVALANEELMSVSTGTGLAGLFALFMVGMVLFVALRSLRLMIASMLTLLAGLIGTAAFATYAVGSLNLISVAFAVLYIGLGIDYTIHLCLRYRELVEQGLPHASAFRQAAGDVGASLVLCGVTTSAGFYAFIPTAYAGVSELGLISGTGMYISLLTNLTLLPALLSLMPLSPEKVGKPVIWRSVTGRFMDALMRHRRAVWVGALVVGVASAVLLPGVEFDYNPINLRDPKTESVATFNELLAESDTSPLTIVTVTPDAKTARETAARLKKLDLVDEALTLKDFVPEDQEEKLDIIGEMDLILGPELELESEPPSRDLERRLHSLGELRANLESFVREADPEQTSSAKRLLELVLRFEDELEGRTRSEREKMLDELEESLVAALPERLKTLRTSLETGPVEFDNLPKDLVERWVSSDARYRVEVFPRENIVDNEALKRFVEQVRPAVPDATGLPVVILKSGEAVVRAFEQAFLYALVFICLLLLALLRSTVDHFLVLTPLFLAGLLMGAASVLLDIPFNFANIIALPLLLGIGVDNGIHMVLRTRAAPPADGNLLNTSTARAVFYSALTTVASFGGLAFSASFGGLAFSRHLGMASMGQLLAIGLSLTLLCTLIVLPTLLRVGKRKT
jgi:hopanoid biosynthesis associated RND transporter like protein HpnN